MARKLEVEIVGDASSLHRALGQADSKASGFGSTIGKVGKTAALAAGAAGIAGLTYAVKTGIGEWAQSQKVTAQTNAVIKSTGGAANVTTKQIQDLSGSLMKKSGVDDEVIQSGANMLLTFTNIRNEAGKGNDVFNQSTKTLLDMSVALGQDASKSAIQLGKALNDPIKGITALQRVGVSFTEAQKTQIAALVKSGHTMEAQKLILHELNKEFGGSAEAAGKTLPGQLAIARESFNNFMGDLVARAIPVLKDVIAWLRDHWGEITAKLQAFWNASRPVLAGFLELAESIVQSIRDHWGTIGPIVEAVGTVIKNTLAAAADVLKIFAALLRGDWSDAWNAWKDALGRVLDNVRTIATTQIQLLATIMRAVGVAMKNAILAGLQGIAGLVWNLITGVGDRITAGLGAVAAWGASIGNRIKSATVGALAGIGGAAWDKINDIGSVIAARAGTIVGWGVDIGASLTQGIANGLKFLGAKIVALVKAAVNYVIDRINSALDFSFSVDTHVPGVGKVGIHFDAPDIPHLAGGGFLHAGQAAVIGERGRELFVPSESGHVMPIDYGRGAPLVVQLVLPDGRVLAEYLIDPLRSVAQRFETQTGRPAFS